MYTILGLAMIYSTGHFFVIQGESKWSDRTTYEKVVTCFAIFSITVTYLNTMFP